FFPNASTSTIYTLSLHDALPIFELGVGDEAAARPAVVGERLRAEHVNAAEAGRLRDRPHVHVVVLPRHDRQVLDRAPEVLRRVADRKSTRLNPVTWPTRMPSSA